MAEAAAILAKGDAKAKVGVAEAEAILAKGNAEAKVRGTRAFRLNFNARSSTRSCTLS